MSARLVNKRTRGWVVLSWLLVLAAVGGWVSPGLAAVIRVPDDQASIQGALDRAQRGDTVRVAQGLFRENVTLKAGVRLEGGWAPDFTRRDLAAYPSTIDGSGKGGWVVAGADHAVLDGFVIQGGRPFDEKAAPVGSGIHCDKTSPILMNNTIAGNRPAGVFCRGSSAILVRNTITGNAEAGIYLEKGSSLVIQENNIRHNGTAGIKTGAAPASRIDVRNNAIHDNGRAGIDAGQVAGGIRNNRIYGNGRTGVKCIEAGVEVMNNTVAANGMAGVMVEKPWPGMAVANNLITHNGDAGLRAAAGVHAYNLLYANNGTADCDPRSLWCIRRQFAGWQDETSYARSHEMVADPGYMDTASHDYRLRPFSPAIDAGDPDARFADRHFGPSQGSPGNDLGASGGPFALPEPAAMRPPPPALVALSAAAAGPPLARITELPGPFATGEEVRLSGGLSRAPAGRPLSYHWQLTRRPPASQSPIADPTACGTTLTLDAAGCYSVQLVVADGVAESPPARLHLCTDQKAKDGIRHVPADYPTIQSAIDAAQDGETVLVQAGRYRENLVIDKKLHLVGVDWPIIDGGLEEGDQDTIHIVHLGEDAGVIEGVVITGGGRGLHGHGIRIWGSSPEIRGNRIAGNGRVGIGIHGDARLTGQARIHDNWVHDNQVGIGNGKGAAARIYRNFIYDNAVAGIGARGQAAPAIEGNVIFGNHTGIGVRDSGPLLVAGNTIAGNEIGISVNPAGAEEMTDSSPLAPGSRIAGNSISGNRRRGLFIASQNRQPFQIAGNAITANNSRLADPARGGGLIFGCPQPAVFAASVAGNILAGNATAPPREGEGLAWPHGPGAMIINAPRALGQPALSLPPILDQRLWLSPGGS
ncbi:MAG: right-handed parallel beta-helix repeat-containing protein [Thermodesulfobacteriota bacterium]